MLLTARQPVFHGNSGLLAYELVYDAECVSIPSESLEDTDTSQINADIESLAGSARVLISFTKELLLAGAPKLLSPEKLLVGVKTGFLSDEDVLSAVRELRGAGYTVVLDGFEYSPETEKFLDLGDIVKIDFRISPIIIEQTANACKNAGKAMLAGGVETFGELEYSERLGCTYAQGFFFAKPAEEENLQPLPANIIRAMQLMSQGEPELSDIVEALSQDAAICGEILKLINSVYFGVANKVSSISQAIVILGLDYLREWVCLMGIRKITQNNNSEALRLSLLNAKFCGKLAEKIPSAAGQRESFYLMGLMSMGVFSGKKSFAKALAQFPLSDDIKNGLLRRGGVYSDVLDMALLYGKADWRGFCSLCGKYGIDAHETPRLYLECTSEVEKSGII